MTTSPDSPTWLDDRDKAILLANGGISGQRVSILDNGHRRRSSTDNIFDVQHGSPLSEASPLLVVLSTASIQIIHPLGDALSHSSSKRLDSLVDLVMQIIVR